MAILELVRNEPNWTGALGAALTRPPGVAERRSGEDPWTTRAVGRPQRISDDLAWFRRAIDEPEAHGLRPLGESSAVATWHLADDEDRVLRLDERGVLASAGFLLHDPDRMESMR